MATANQLPFLNLTTLGPSLDKRLLSPTYDIKTFHHRKIPSATNLPPSTFTSSSFISRQPSSSMGQHSSSMDCSPIFQPSSPVRSPLLSPSRSPMQSPRQSPRSGRDAPPILNRAQSCFPSSSSSSFVNPSSSFTPTTGTPRSTTPNLPSQDELTLQNIHMALNKCKQHKIFDDEQIKFFLQVYSNL